MIWIRAMHKVKSSGRLRPMGTVIVLLTSSVLLPGCRLTFLESDGVKPGMSERQLVRKLGPPDFIEEQSGDLARIYTVEQPLEYKWPNDSKKTYYYLSRDLEIIVTKGRVQSVGSVSRDREEIQLLLDGVSNKSSPPTPE